MAHPKIFGVSEPSDLFKLICEAYSEYVGSPNERNFLFLCFGLHHLREWILGTGEYAPEIRIKRIPESDRTEAEQFFLDIGQLEEFCLVRKFSNSGKHGNPKKALPSTSKETGFMFEVSSFGDDLDQVNFLLGDKNSRDIFVKVLERYRNWFETLPQG